MQSFIKIGPQGAENKRAIGQTDTAIYNKMVTNPKKSKSKNLPADAMTVKKYCTFSLHFHIIF